MTDKAQDPADHADVVDPRLQARPWQPEEVGVLDSLVTSLVETRRVIAAMQAFEATVLSAAAELTTARVLSGSVSELSIREVSAEIGSALHVNDRTVQNLLGNASVLTRLFPATHRALQEGRISTAHVRVIVDAGGAIGDAEARAGYEAAVLQVAESETAGRLRPIARVLADRADPVPLTDRHARARAARQVRVTDIEDGMSLLQAPLPAVLAHGIFDRLTGMARTVVDTRRAAASPAFTSPGSLDAAADGGDVEVLSDERTMDQLRADLLSDLLLTGTPTAHGDGLDAIHAMVQVTVPVLTLAGAADTPALLAGHGPVDPATARRLAAGAPGWERVLTHPVSGQVLAVDRYRPGRKLRRWLRVRDEHCRFRAAECRRGGATSTTTTTTPSAGKLTAITSRPSANATTC